MKKYLLGLFVVLTFSILAGFPLLQTGLPPTHDGEYHVIRFYEFDKALRSGQLYPRWANDLNNGYGVPLFNYVYPLPNYVASILHFFGTSFIDGFKLNMFLGLLASSIFMFLFVGAYFGVWGGIVASVFYTFAPYHLLDIYIRGSVGEVWALAFFPAALWSIKTALSEKGKQFKNTSIFLPVSALFLALLIFSHNILAFVFFPIVISYMCFLIFSGKDRRVVAFKSIVMLVMGVSLSAIFWLPALFEKEYVRGLDIFDYRRHFVEIYQLVFPSWGSGFSGDTSTEGLSLQIGLMHIFVLCVTFLLIVISIIKKRLGKKIKISLFMLLWTVLAVFFMHEISAPFWQLIPLLQFAQFPWRLLSIVIFCVSFLAGGLFNYNQNKKMKILAVVFISFVVLLGIGYSKPPYYLMRDDYYYTSRSNFIDGTNSPGNAFNTIWFNTSLPKREKKIEQNGDTIIVNTAYFPGWQVYENGNKIKTGVSKDGLIKAKRSSSGGIVTVRFLDTPIQALAKGISFVSLVLLFLLLIRSLPARMKK